MIATFNIEKYYSIVGDLFKDLMVMSESYKPRLSKIGDKKYVIDFMSGKLIQAEFILNFKIGHKKSSVYIEVELDLFKYLKKKINKPAISYSLRKFNRRTYLFTVQDVQASSVILEVLKEQIYEVEKFLGRSWSCMPMYLDCSIPKYYIYKYYLINYPIFVILKCIRSI